MTQIAGTNRVSLTLGNWLTIAGICLTQAAALIGFGVNLQMRLASNEANTAAIVQQLSESKATLLRLEDAVQRKFDRLEDRLLNVERRKTE